MVDVAAEMGREGADSGLGGSGCGDGNGVAVVGGGEGLGWCSGAAGAGRNKLAAAAAWKAMGGDDDTGSRRGTDVGGGATGVADGQDRTGQAAPAPAPAPAPVPTPAQQQQQQQPSAREEMRVLLARPGSALPSKWIGYWRRAELPLDPIGTGPLTGAGRGRPCAWKVKVCLRLPTHLSVYTSMYYSDYPSTHLSRHRRAVTTADSHLVAAQPAPRRRSHQANPKSRFARRHGCAPCDQNPGLACAVDMDIAWLHAKTAASKRRRIAARNICRNLAYTYTPLGCHIVHHIIPAYAKRRRRRRRKKYHRYLDTLLSRSPPPPLPWPPMMILFVRAHTLTLT